MEHGGVEDSYKHTTNPARNAVGLRTPNENLSTACFPG